MNIGFYKDLDTNFEQACLLSQQVLSHYELLDLLQNGNITQKQIAALRLDNILTVEEASIFISNLTGCDGKIREAVAFKLYQLIKEIPQTRNILAQMPPEIFANATIDINANICRFIVDSVKTFNDYITFTHKYTNIILCFAKEALDKLDKCFFKDKKYIKNKQLFKLYWCLETMKNFYKTANRDELLNILNRSSLQSEYTIREKAAQISILSKDFSDIQNLLKNDTNYYVKTVFLNH